MPKFKINCNANQYKKYYMTVLEEEQGKNGRQKKIPGTLLMTVCVHKHVYAHRCVHSLEDKFPT